MNDHEPNHGNNKVLQQRRRAVRPLSAHDLDKITKLGCSDPDCTVPAEEHDELWITSGCHMQEKLVHAFYDSVTKELCFACAVCGKGFMKAKVQ